MINKLNNIVAWETFIKSITLTRKEWSKCLLHVLGHYPLWSLPHVSKEFSPSCSIWSTYPTIISLSQQWLHHSDIAIYYMKLIKWRTMLVTSVASIIITHLHGWWHHPNGILIASKSADSDHQNPTSWSFLSAWHHGS